jgi:hypothetical protein
MKNTRIGFHQDTRSREDLERDGYVLRERLTAPISKKDSAMVRVEIYMRGSEMLMKVLEPPEDIGTIKHA